MSREKFMDWLSQEIDLPGETLPGQCVVELAGDRRVLIENHSGICQYSSCTIGVKVSYGILFVYGESLEIVRMSGKQLVITGRINAMEIKRGSGK